MSEDDAVRQSAVDDEPIVYAATAPNEPIARLWADVLGDEGIRAMLKAAGPGIGAWASAATLEHELHVLRPDVERARQIIQDLEGEADDSGWQDGE